MLTVLFRLLDAKETIAWTASCNRGISEMDSSAMRSYGYT